MPQWTMGDIPDQDGRVAIVTGSSGGLGAEAAVALAAKRARVILAVRNQQRGEAVRDRILRNTPGAQAEVSLVDMASLASVRGFAERMVGELPQADILINNAGLLQAKRGTSVDGFERVFATNHLGAFALTGLLMPLLLRTPAARVVAVASLAHRTARVDFDDLQGARRYSGGKAYGQSKLANLMFAQELDRRARAASSTLVSVAAHPGLSTTGFADATGMPPAVITVFKQVFRVVGQSAARGALPLLYAATMPGVRGGDYWGPDGVFEARGAPASAVIARHARDPAVWQRLWTVSEQLTGVVYQF